VKKNYEIKIKVNKSEMPKFENFLTDLVAGEIGPEMGNAMRDVLLYQKLNPGQRKDWAAFRSAHAGILSEAVLDNIQKKYIDLTNTAETYVEVADMPNGQELIIKGKLNEESTKNINLSPEAILKLASGLNPIKSKHIIERSIDQAGYDE